MTYKTVEQLPLADAVEEIFYGASCNRCRETRHVDLVQLRDRLGPQFLVGNIRRRLRCSKGGTRRVQSNQTHDSSYTTIQARDRSPLTI